MFEAVSYDKMYLSIISSDRITHFFQLKDGRERQRTMRRISKPPFLEPIHQAIMIGSAALALAVPTLAQGITYLAWASNDTEIWRARLDGSQLRQVVGEREVQDTAAADLDAGKLFFAVRYPSLGLSGLIRDLTIAHVASDTFLEGFESGDTSGWTNATGGI